MFPSRGGTHETERSDENRAGVLARFRLLRVAQQVGVSQRADVRGSCPARIRQARQRHGRRSLPPHPPRSCRARAAGGWEVRLTPTETQFLAEFGSRRRFILWIRLWGVRRSVSLSDLRQMLWRLTILKLIDMDDRRLMPRVF